MCTIHKLGPAQVELAADFYSVGQAAQRHLFALPLHTPSTQSEKLAAFSAHHLSAVFAPSPTFVMRNAISFRAKNHAKIYYALVNSLTTNDIKMEIEHGTRISEISSKEEASCSAKKPCQKAVVF